MQRFRANRKEDVLWQLIETEEYNMAQIAYMVGLNDSHYFSKCFKQQYGMTPTEYKEKRKQVISN